jgi:hypothetical protein
MRKRNMAAIVVNDDQRSMLQRRNTYLDLTTKLLSLSNYVSAEKVTKPNRR